MTLEMPSDKIEKEFEGIKIGMHVAEKPVMYDVKSELSAYVELQYKGKRISARFSFDWSAKFDGKHIVSFLNDKLLSYGIVLDQEKFAPIIDRELLPKFYPESKSK